GGGATTFALLRTGTPCARQHPAGGQRQQQHTAHVEHRLRTHDGPHQQCPAEQQPDHCAGAHASLPDDGCPVHVTCPAGTSSGHGPISSSELRSALTHQERSEEHTSELQSRFDLVCRLLLEKKNNKT